MSARRRFKPYVWEPLTMTAAEVAERVFRRSEAWFIANTPADFPRPIDGLYATESVERWHRERHGLAESPTTAKDATRVLLGRLGNGRGAVDSAGQAIASTSVRACIGKNYALG